MTMAAIPPLKPRTKPAAAISLMSPPPIPPQTRAAIRSGRAERQPSSFTGVKQIKPVRAIASRWRQG